MPWTASMPTTASTKHQQSCHVFLSHAGEHKRGFVDFLEVEFKKRFPAVRVFLDEYTLEPAGRAMDNIHAALQDAFVGERAAPVMVVLVVLGCAWCGGAARSVCVYMWWYSQEQKRHCALTIKVNSQSQL
jgi:hypothetical protein